MRWQALSLSTRKVLVLSVVLAVSLAARGSAGASESEDLRADTDKVIQPLMATWGIPGMSVGITVNGSHHVYLYGVASRQSGEDVTERTLFEIGSLSKTLTATLAAYAQERGDLSLSDMTSADFPTLRGSAFDAIPLSDLGTHTAGGLPLQVPDDIVDDRALYGFLKRWKPPFAPGTVRAYSNLSIGLLGLVTAARMHGDFASLLRENVLIPLGMRRTFLDVPAAEMEDYAQGYTSRDMPIRMASGPLAEEAYGIRTTAEDMLRFLDANVARPSAASPLLRAIAATHRGYFRTGGMVQALIWEEYPTPVSLKSLLAGNAPTMIRDPHAVDPLTPPQDPPDAVLIDKTGSTNGFGAYAVVVPDAKIGIVILANKNYPIEARVTAAAAILARLAPAVIRPTGTAE